MLHDKEIVAAAERLWQAEESRHWTEPLTSVHANATVEDAYQIAMSVRKLKESASRIVKGHKIGLTSKAMQDMAGTTEPDYGFVYDDWFRMEGERLSRAAMNRPLVEVELAFVIGTDIRGPNTNVADVIRAVDFVLPCLEIVDSRYAGYGSNMLVDSISDSASCGLIVLGGNPCRLNDVDVRCMSASLALNGTIIETGSARAVMANPLNAVVWLANKLYEFGVTLRSGDVILSGSFVRAIPLNVGDMINAQFDQLGDVSISIGD